MQQPYHDAISAFKIIEDQEIVKSPFEMVQVIANISKNIEETITQFWEGITIIDADKLVIDGDNILMLYLYIIISAKISKICAYMKMMDEFSTPYVRSISRYGYCLSTLEIALERLTNMSIQELIMSQNQSTIIQRSNLFVKDL